MRCLARGFTLIELMVVVVIISIIITFAVVAIRVEDSTEVAHEELQRLSALLDLAADQALLEGREYGTEFYNSSFRFLVYGDGQWSELQEDRLLRPRQLTEGLLFSLVVDGVEVDLESESESESGSEPVETDEQQKRLKPQLIIYSSGERTPFSITIALQESSELWRLTGGLYDRLLIESMESP